jgi:hypothetical protein
MHRTRAVKDLALGDRIRVDGFDENQTVRNAKPITHGLDAGLRELTLAAPDGQTERIAVAAEDPVAVVGPAPATTQGRRGHPKAKGKVPRKAKPVPPAAAAPLPPAATTLPPAPAAGTAQQPRRPQQAPGEKRRSCLDAAAQVLSETRQPLSCPELIAAMAAQGSWTSPAGKTPAATLYAALLREIRTKKDQARFRKTGPGRFARA